MLRGRAPLIVCLALGCGRIGFDDATSDGITPGTGDWQAVSVGEEYACAIAIDGSLWCWGSNDSYQCGAGEVSRAPVTRVTTDIDWASVAAGVRHTCAIKTDGSLWCWGSDKTGQLGDGTGGDETELPAQVGADRDWAEVGVGNLHTCARKTAGSVWCWGDNGWGELGLGLDTSVSVARPTQVGTASDWTQLAVTFDSTCGVRADASAWCWGENNAGHLGTGGSGFETVPVATHPARTWKHVEVGDDHACGVDTDDRLWCWGQGTHGQLGAEVPNNGDAVEVAGGGTWASVTLGLFHSCGVRTDGTAWCWGDTSHGQHGSVVLEPVRAPMPRGVGIQHVSARQHHTCWLGDAGGIVCSGDVSGGQRPGDPPREPAELVRIDAGWSAIAAGITHACGLRPSGEVACWGQGILGDGLDADRQVPTTVMSGIAKLAAGENYTVAIGTDGSLWQWGNTPGPGAWQLAPEQIGAGRTWLDVGAGREHACAIAQGDELWCWGYNDYGQLGDGTMTGRLTLDQVPGQWIAVAGGAYHTCAIDAAQAMHCWGFNKSGQLGCGSTGDVATPTPIVSGETTWVQVVAGDRSTCGRLASGEVWCWGDNDAHQLDAPDPQTSIPVRAQSFADWQELVSGTDHVCGFRASAPGELWCWGSPGIASFANATPVGAFTSYAGGQRFGCARAADASRWCWGDNHVGQYGDGGSWSTAPWPITRP